MEETNQQEIYLKDKVFWIDRHFATQMYAVWMMDKKIKFDLPSYVTNFHNLPEDCIDELERKFGKDIVKKMNIYNAVEEKNEGLI